MEYYGDFLKETQSDVELKIITPGISAFGGFQSRVVGCSRLGVEPIKYNKTEASGNKSMFLTLTNYNSAAKLETPGAPLAQMVEQLTLNPAGRGEDRIPARSISCNQITTIYRQHLMF